MHTSVLPFREDGIYWEHTYGNTFRESVSMKFIMSQVASDVVAFLRLARKKKGGGKGGKSREKKDKSTLSDLISVSEKLKTTNDLWLPGATIKRGHTRKKRERGLKAVVFPS